MWSSDIFNLKQTQTRFLLTASAAEGSDNIAMVYLQFLTTAAGVCPMVAPCSTSSSHCNYMFGNKMK